MSELPGSMQRIVKRAGVGNIELENAPVPAPGPRQVLVRTHRTLISRGSEIGGRYRRREQVPAGTMGYSAAGDVVEVGRGVTEYRPGDRVAVVGPHAGYLLGDVDAIGAMAVTPMPDDVSYDQAVFHPLAVGAVLWTRIAAIRPGETVVVSGQGLVGNLVLQAARRFRPRQLIAVDTVAERCDLALRFGAGATVNASQENPVTRVRELTGGEGADLVMECVGGPAGVRSFAASVAMTRRLGRIHLIGLYHEQPLPLDSTAIQQRQIIGGYFADLDTEWRPAATDAMHMLARRDLDIEPLLTHRFAPADAREAFAMLHDRPSEALGVVFTWET